MVIDFHTHIFPDAIAPGTISSLEDRAHIKAFSDGTLNGLRSSMEEADVAVSVILPVVTRPGQFSSINRYAREITAEEYRPGEKNLVSFGGIHPDSDNYKEEVDEIAHMGLKGIKLHPDYQRVFIDDIRYLRIIDRAAEKGLIVSVHAGLDIGLPDPVHCTPERVDSLLRQMDPDKLVLAHMGGYDCWDQVEELLAGRKLYLDTAYSFRHIGDSQFLRLIKKHGADRILFATDSPWSGQKEDMAYIKGLELTEEELEQILWKNGYELLWGKKTR